MVTFLPPLTNSNVGYAHLFLVVSYYNWGDEWRVYWGKKKLIYNYKVGPYDRCKWSYGAHINGQKIGLYNWGYFTRLMGVITPVITGRGPTLGISVPYLETPPSIHVHLAVQDGCTIDVLWHHPCLQGESFQGEVL